MEDVCAVKYPFPCCHNSNRCLVERFYVSKMPSLDGSHQVHTQVCDFIPPEGERLFLGISPTSNQAVGVAQNLFTKVIPCECCLERAVTIMNEHQVES